MNSGEICHHAKIFMGAGEEKIAEMIQQEQGAAGASWAGTSYDRNKPGRSKPGQEQARQEQSKQEQSKQEQARQERARQEQAGAGTSQGRSRPDRAWHGSPRQERTHQKRLRISDFEMFGLSSRIQVYYYCFRS